MELTQTLLSFLYTYQALNIVFDFTPESANTPTGPEVRNVDLDQVTVYDRFQYSCSRNTSRIYLYDEVGGLAELDIGCMKGNTNLNTYSYMSAGGVRFRHSTEFHRL